MNSDVERLLERAKVYWESGHVIPLDLFAQMNEAGMDVQRLEDKYFTSEE